jgi:hypothetical protein
MSDENNPRCRSLGGDGRNINRSFGGPMRILAIAALIGTVL